ncbi:MAG: PD40 domain-containing protein [Acidobacteria bacterium]|nr:PD40 domain-containing protein [Acidobacteriota bacterium]
MLGRFRVKIDGDPVDEKRWGRRSAKSLVKLLALKPHHALHREQIMDLLWSEEPAETALNSLNKAIYGARRALEPGLAKGAHSGFILTQSQQIILDSPGMLVVDLDEFEKLANYALLNGDLRAGQKAVEAYCGDLLIEDIYEDWIYTRRESARILFRKIATKTAELYAAAGESQAGVQILKKLVAEDPTDEYGQRLLMRIYAETGSKFQAAKQFEQCRAALRNLGLNPETETAELAEQIKHGGIVPTPTGQDRFIPPAAGSTPRVTPLTFQNGRIKSAKFLPGGQTILLGAAWNGAVRELYTLELGAGENRPLGITDAAVLAVSAEGAAAVLLNARPIGFYRVGTLAKVPATGGSAVEILEDVHWADWHPLKSRDPRLKDAEKLAVVRDGKGKNRLEFPVGRVICETEGWFGHPRFSADGKKIAFIEHPFVGDDRGFVALVDLESGKNAEKRILTRLYSSIQGAAWSTDEIWFSASRQGSGRSIKAVDLKGETRTVYRATGNLTLHDVSADGRVLVTDDKTRVPLVARRADEENERDLSWHDWTLPRDLTDDGETLLFEEGGLSGGDKFAAYTRKTDGSGVKKIGDGSALALSPDGKYALLRLYGPNRLALVPTGAGETVELESDPAAPLEYDVYACFSPDGKQILFTATDPGGRKMIFVQDLGGGKPVPFAAAEKGLKMISSRPFSPDGRYSIFTDRENRLTLYRISDGGTAPLRGLEKDFWLIRWAAGGEQIFVWRRGEIPAVVYKYDLRSGTKEEWRRLMPKDAAGFSQIGAIKLTPDGRTCAYCYLRESSDLYLLENLR